MKSERTCYTSAECIDECKKAYNAGRMQVLEQLQEKCKEKPGVGYYEFSVNDEGNYFSIKYEYDHDRKHVWGYKTAAEVVEWLDQQTVKEK